MTKKKRAGRATNAARGGEISEIVIERRTVIASRAEKWVIDGIRPNGERQYGVGELAIILDEYHYCHVTGGVDHDYSLTNPEKLENVLCEVMERLGYSEGWLDFHTKHGSLQFDWKW